ncbi:MAG: RraA family protein [Candidatus Parcubacteria bacterium]|nr:RraA family protein [Burkholderiales bacterium]
MRAPRISPDLLQAYKYVSVPNVCDALDRLGVGGAPRDIVQTWPMSRKLVGTACTMKLVPLGQPSIDSPVLGTLRAIMAGYQGDVLVIDFGGNREVNSMGGVAGATAVHHGLVGCVSDGVVRDIDEYKMLDFPVYARGPIQSSIRNRCGFAGHDIEVKLGGVAVHPGDLIFGDESGVLVVPKAKIEETLKLAQQLKGIEDSVIAAVRRGEDPVAAHEKVRYDSMTG